MLRAAQAEQQHHAEAREAAYLACDPQGLARSVPGIFITGGPIVVVYPDGIWYRHVTPKVLDRIVTEHLRAGKVVDEFVFFRL